MLDEDGDVGELEGSVQKCDVQGFAERKVCGFHGAHRVSDVSGSGDDVRHVDNQQADDDTNGQDRCNFPHQIGSENGDDEDEQSDQERTEQVRQTGQCAQRCAAGCEGHGRGNAHDAEI